MTQGIIENANLFVSVIVPEVDAKEEDVKDLLTSLLASDYPEELFEVIIVDDGSEENTIFEVLRTIPNRRKIRIQLIRSQRNRGPGSARNLGAHFARGDILAFTDSDCIARKDWLRTIVTLFSEFPEAAALSGPPDVWPRSGVVGRCENHLIRTFFLEWNDGFKLSGKALRGGNAAIRRKVFFSLNGFDESLRTKEDHELAQRILASGNKIYFSNKMRGYHKFRQSLPDLWKQSFHHAVGDGMVFLSHPNLIYKERLALLLLLVGLVVSSVFIAILNVVVAVAIIFIAFLFYFPFFLYIKRKYLKDLTLREKITLPLVSMTTNSGWCFGFLIGVVRRIRRRDTGQTEARKVRE